MITWIQTVLQKHNKPIFIVLLVVIIIAFVFTIGSVPFLGDRNRRMDATKDFYGFNLNDAATVERLRAAVTYEYVLGYAPIRTDEQFSNFVLRHAFLLSVARQLGLMGVSEAELAAYVRNAPRFAGANGSFDEASWANFVKQQTASGRLTDAALSAIISENAMVAKVEKLLGFGYIPEFDIKRQYDEVYGTWSFEAAVLDYKTFEPKLDTTPEGLRKFYEANKEALRIGEGVEVSAAFFASKDFAGKTAVPSDADLTAFYNANSSRYTKLEENGTRSVQPFAAVRGSVMADLVSSRALKAASDFAEDLALKIYNAEAKKGSAELANILKEAKVELKSVPAFRTTDSASPKEIPYSVAAAAMALDADRFYTDPITVDDGVWIVFLDKKLPSYIPSFDEAIARVKTLDAASQKRSQFSKKASELAKALKAAKDFAAAATQAGAKVEKVENLVLANIASNPALPEFVRNNIDVIASELGRAKVGDVSEARVTASSCMVFNITKFEAPKDTDKAKLAKMIGNVEDMYGVATASSVVGDAIKHGRIAEE